MKSIIHRKEMLILTVIEIIDELGIQGLSTREIARRQDISEATIFRHYSGKTELLCAVLDYFTQFDEDIFMSSCEKDLTSIDAIRFYVNSYVEYYENYPAIISVMQVADFFMHEPILSEKIKLLIQKRQSNLEKLIIDAQMNNEIDINVESGLIIEIINGIIKEISMNWKRNTTSFSLKKRIMRALDLVINTDCGF